MIPNNANYLLAGLSLIGIRPGYNERMPDLDLTKDVKILALLATDDAVADDVPTAIKCRVLDLLSKHDIQMVIGHIRWKGV